MNDALGHSKRRRPHLSITWLLVLVAAIWVIELASRSISPPRASFREPTSWERIAQRYGDFRTDDQIHQDNRLVYAVRDGDKEKARLALVAGADPNARYLDACGPGYTALMEASGLGNEELVGLLLEQKARPNLGYDGDTPLRLAIRAGHNGVVQRLRAAGARDDK